MFWSLNDQLKVDGFEDKVEGGGEEEETFIKIIFFL